MKKNYTRMPMTMQQALTGALALAICAPSQRKFEQAVELAEDLASNLSQREINLAKQNAISLARQWEREWGDDYKDPHSYLS